MRVIRSVAELRIALKQCRESGKRIGFVPTMGFLHEGHGSLIRQSTARCDVTVVSIFVNPTQFGPGEDLSRYPRDPENDQSLCLRMGVDILFMPEVQEMYPSYFGTHIEPGPIAESLCGRFRPGHFRGVATVVAKLFNIVLPDLAFFGQKDLQQTAVIKRMVKDLNMPVDVVVAPTIREVDGLALSSRNIYLSPEDRKRALAISRGLFAAESAFRDGERQVQRLEGLARDPLQELDSLQYCDVVDAQSLEPLDGTLDRPAAIAVAGYVGPTRLIDNILLVNHAESNSLSALPSQPFPLPG